ncbi:hypothetical protein Igni_0439 [Ignicoccus hospitalis KIN4/I]|uniref:Archaeosortase A n=1 Tax=Ignicoccus hospitalis (strain KIN4/I / DSM 18386 / JCM 14125) TaxID=453591 RepID=A8A9M0_IGNH4|nr:hypothetical protein Igni_0439 [Ignicoccus hospitalis KIN4/I]
MEGERGLIERLSAIALLLLTAHALWVHASAGEVEPLEVVALEALWAPVLLRAPCDKRALLVVFAGFSGYFLPRLIPYDAFLKLAITDVIFNNYVLRPLGVEMKVTNGEIVIFYDQRPYAVYAVGCSSLRSGAFLALMPLAARGSLGRRLLAAALGYLLSYPFNALRVAAIVVAGEALGADPFLAHLLVSPLASVLIATLIMVVQELVLPGYLEEVSEGVECLLKLAKPWWRSRST